MPDQAWVLTERLRNGKERIVGVALDNDTASEWVRRNDVEGEARTSMPYPVVRFKPRPVSEADR